MYKTQVLTLFLSVLCMLQHKVHAQVAVECYTDINCMDLESSQPGEGTEAEEICCQNLQVLGFKIEGDEACQACPEGRTAAPTTTEAPTTMASTTEAMTTTSQPSTTQREASQRTTMTQQAASNEQQDPTDENDSTAGTLGGLVYNGGYIIVFSFGVIAFILGH